MPETMKVAAFEGNERSQLEERPLTPMRPERRDRKNHADDDLRDRRPHLARGIPGRAGRIVGHEPVGVIHQLGEAVEGYAVGERVLVGAITPCGTCFYLPVAHRSRSAPATRTTGR